MSKEQKSRAAAESSKTKVPRRRGDKSPSPGRRRRGQKSKSRSRTKVPAAASSSMDKSPSAASVQENIKEAQKRFGGLARSVVLPSMDAFRELHIKLNGRYGYHGQAATPKAITRMVEGGGCRLSTAIELLSERGFRLVAVPQGTDIDLGDYLEALKKQHLLQVQAVSEAKRGLMRAESEMAFIIERQMEFE